jgi:hypothetical protein
LSSEYGSNINSIDYSYSCASASFVCLDPAATNASLTCDAVAVPTVDTYKNASCGNFELDPRYGDGFCDADLNYQECNYDGGDCCDRTCRVNRFVPGGCSPSSLLNCRDPKIGNRELAYINPPKVNRECRPFVYDNGLPNVRLITKVNAAITVCDQRDISVTEVGEFFAPGACPGNFTIRRVWRITDTNTSTSSEQEQLITVSATVPLPDNPRPISLWRRSGGSSSLDGGRYSLGLLRSSPFFDFINPDACTGSIQLAFVSCENVATGSSSRCVYNTGTDELAIITPTSGDLWQVKVRLTDECGLTSIYSSPVVVSSTNNDAAPSSVTVSGTIYPSLDTSICQNSVISSQLPSPKNKLLGLRAQVCTQIFAEALPTPASYTTTLDGLQRPSTVQICLRVTRQPSQCTASAAAGRLRAFFLDTRDFGINNPGDVGVINSTMALGRSCSSISSTGAGNLSSCSGWYVKDDVSDDFGEYNLAFEVAGSSFDSVTGEADLGCFFLQAANITAPTAGWEVGLVYSNVDGNVATTSTMVGQVCATDPSPIPPLVNVERNVISTRIPASTIDGSDDIVCIAIDSPRIIDPSTASICLSTTTQYPGCASSTRAGRLDRILLESTRFGVADPDALTFESGPSIRLSRPYCTRHPVNANQLSLDCSAQGLRDPPLIKGASVTVALPVFNVTWQSSDQPLGCFYATSPDLYSSQTQNFSSSQFKDWAFAFQFSRFAGGSYNATGTAYMGGVAFSDPVPADAPSTATTCPRNELTIRVPQGDDQDNTRQVKKVQKLSTILFVDDLLSPSFPHYFLPQITTPPQNPNRSAQPPMLLPLIHLLWKFALRLEITSLAASHPACKAD